MALLYNLKHQELLILSIEILTALYLYQRPFSLLRGEPVQSISITNLLRPVWGLFSKQCYWVENWVHLVR